jgi:hypothetical protein
MEYIYLFTYFIYCMDDEANNDEGENVEWHLYADSDRSKICAVGKYAEGAAHVICEGIAGSIAFTVLRSGKKLIGSLIISMP